MNSGDRFHQILGFQRGGYSSTETRFVKKVAVQKTGLNVRIRNKLHFDFATVPKRRSDCKQ